MAEELFYYCKIYNVSENGKRIDLENQNLVHVLHAERINIPFVTFLCLMFSLLSKENACQFLLLATP